MRTILLLTISNIFMTFAWYGHLKYRKLALWKVVVASWASRYLNILLPGSREPHRFVRIQRRTAEDHPGSHHSFRLFGFSILHLGEP